MYLVDFFFLLITSSFGMSEVFSDDLSDYCPESEDDYSDNIEDSVYPLSTNFSSRARRHSNDLERWVWNPLAPPSPTEMNYFCGHKTLFAPSHVLIGTSLICVRS